MIIINYLLGYSIVVVFISKIIIHIRLEIKNGQKLLYSPFELWRYIVPYQKNVLDEYIKLKVVCNYLFKILICLFILDIINLVYLDFAF